MSALSRLSNGNGDRNPLQEALDNYHEMENQRDEAINRADSMNATNAALVTEIGVLRDQLARSDAERIRLNAVGSTLLGRLMAIHDTIAGAVKAAAREGVLPNDGLEQAGAEAQSILQRVQTVQPPETPETPKPPQRAPQEAGAVGGVIPVVDWSRLPQG
jgi:hypothetical protein